MLTAFTSSDLHRIEYLCSIEEMPCFGPPDGNSAATSLGLP